MSGVEAVYTREENGENQWTAKTQSCFTPHSKNKIAHTHMVMTV